MAKRAAAKPPRADDKRVVGSAKVPKKVAASAGKAAGDAKAIKYVAKRPTRGAGRPKKV